ncbi:MAG: ABC transporter ATP-binding protein/permease [Oscillospiraceae bacterium]|jgi:ATP-binding cassette subfamily B protein|nr:ABC transporter ATP-binding protein/permease [Oscillospiraceae bacterium]
MEEPKPLKGLAKLRYIWFLMKPMWKYGKTYMIITLFMSVALQPISAVVSALLPKYAIDAVMSQKTAKQTILIIAGFTAITLAVNLVQQLISSLLQNVAQTKVSYKILYDVNEKALYTDFKYYDNPKFFTMFTYAQQNYANQVQSVSQMVPQMLGSLVSMAAMGAIISSAGPVLFIITIAFVLLQLPFSVPQMKLSANANVELTAIARPLNYVYRVLQQKENTAEMRSSDAGKKMLKVFSDTLDKYIVWIYKFYKKMLKWSIPQGFLSPIQSAIVLIYIIVFVIDGDTSKIGLYASLTAASAQLSGNINGFFSMFTNLFQNMLYGERIAAFFEAESVIEPVRSDLAPAPDGVYDVELRDISFRYENAEFGLDNFTMKIPAGKRVAIVGENGAGKSTLTKLLVRLYDVNSGSVLINGRDIREYDVHALRKHIGIAYQDVRVLAMSLRDNLTVYNDVPDEELLKIIDKLGLNAVLEKVNGDLGTMVSREFTEDGAVLSGGEAQRVSLARLFTGHFGLLLLDEPSSALDPLAEYKLMQMITDKANTATTVMIAHRLSTVRDFDVIYHVENGAIIETGTHDELMALRGKYFEMFTRQAENYQNEASEAEV